MTTLEGARPVTLARDSHIDIAGTAWPLYKLEALAVGFVVLVVAGLSSPAPHSSAVLTAAAATVVVWWVAPGVLPRATVNSLPHGTCRRRSRVPTRGQVVRQLGPSNAFRSPISADDGSTRRTVVDRPHA